MKDNVLMIGEKKVPCIYKKYSHIAWKERETAKMGAESIIFIKLVHWFCVAIAKKLYGSER